jgi:hypothetical protein
MTLVQIKQKYSSFEEIKVQNQQTEQKRREAEKRLKHLLEEAIPYVNLGKKYGCDEIEEFLKILFDGEFPICDNRLARLTSFFTVSCDLFYGFYGFFNLVFVDDVCSVGYCLQDSRGGNCRDRDLDYRESK